jgi:membrane-associated phospholipid phosphatase
MRGKGLFTFVDYATQAYLGLVGLIVLCWHGRAVANWPLLVAAHAAGIAAIGLLVRFNAARPGVRILDFFRHFYPVLLYGPLYCETGWLNHLFVSGFLDAPLIRLEARIFGLQPSLTLMDRLPYLAVSEVLYASYFSYYLMIVGVGLALFLRNRGQFFHYLSVVSFVFYVCYFVFIFTPVVGPRIFFKEFGDYPLPAGLVPAQAPDFPAAIQAGPFFKVMAGIYRNFEEPGASFPSSHVAIALTTVFFSFLYLRRIRWAHFAVMILLCVATVYCRYHYAVDVFAGILAASVLVPLGNRLYLRFQTSRS